MSGLRLGSRELQRAPGRFLLLAGVLGLLLALLVAFRGIADEHVKELQGAVARSSADVLVTDAAAEWAVQASRVDAEDLARVAAHAGVAEAAPIGALRVGARLPDGEAVNLSLWGAEQGATGEVEVVDGRPPQEPGEAAVDRADAFRGAALGATVRVDDTGDDLEIVGMTEDRRFAAIPTAYVAYEQWETIVEDAVAETDDVEATAIAVRAAEGRDPEALAAALSDGDLAAATPAAAGALLPGVAGVQTSFRLLSVVVVLALAVLSGVATSLIVAARRPEIATLRALGAPLRTVATTVAVQMTGVVAGASGFAAALVAAATVLAPPHVPLVPSAGLWATSAATTLAAAVATAAVVAWRGGRVPPVESLGAGE